jgi:ParB family chromosome partitioning protein
LAKSEKRLGKGLGALLGEQLEEEPGDAVGERQVEVDRVRPNPFQPRSEFEPGALGELAESIRENGLLQPLVVRPAGEEWELVAGERRWRAVRELGWDRAPAVVRELEDEQMVVLALVENLQRENLSPLEEAVGYQQLIDSFGLTQQAVAERVGRDRSTISNTLRLLELEGRPRELLQSGELTAGHARALLSLDDAGERRRLAEEVVEEGLSVRATERRVRELRNGAGSDGGATDDGEAVAEEAGEGDGGDPVARRAAKILERALGTEVRVRLRGAEKGEIGIVFHDSDEFERLCGLLAGDGAEALFG